MIFLLTQMLCNFPTDGQFYIPIDPYIDNRGGGSWSTASNRPVVNRVTC
jgi:hypothetical protein